MGKVKGPLRLGRSSKLVSYSRAIDEQKRGPHTCIKNIEKRSEHNSGESAIQPSGDLRSQTAERVSLYFLHSYLRGWALKISRPGKGDKDQGDGAVLTSASHIQVLKYVVRPRMSITKSRRTSTGGVLSTYFILFHYRGYPFRF